MPPPALAIMAFPSTAGATAPMPTSTAAPAVVGDDVAQVAVAAHEVTAASGHGQHPRLLVAEWRQRRCCRRSGCPGLRAPLVDPKARRAVVARDQVAGLVAHAESHDVARAPELFGAPTPLPPDRSFAPLGMAAVPARLVPMKFPCTIDAGVHISCRVPRDQVARIGADGGPGRAYSADVVRPRRPRTVGQGGLPVRAGPDAVALTMVAASTPSPVLPLRRLSMTL